MTADLTLFSDDELARSGTPVAGTAAGTDYWHHYQRLGGERGRLTDSSSPLGPGLAAGDAGVPGGMVDHDHAAGKPSRRELELAEWLTAEVPDELKAAQFDIATLLAGIERQRYLHGLATRNMLEAQHRAFEAEQREKLTPAGQLASQLAVTHMIIARLERQQAMDRAALALCAREHCAREGSESGQ